MRKIVIELQLEIINNLFHQFNKKDYLQYSYFDSPTNKDYEIEIMAIADRLHYNLYGLGVRAEPSECLQIIHNSEMLMLTEIGSHIPNIDERNVVIKNFKYNNPYTLYILLQVFLTDGE